MKTLKNVGMAVIALSFFSVPALAQDAVEEACKAEIEEYCADVEADKLAACLKEHEADLSDACKAAIQQ